MQKRERLSFTRPGEARRGSPVFVPRDEKALVCETPRRALVLWRSSRPDPAELPATKDFDILDYRAVVHHLNLIEVSGEPWDFVFRVHCVAGGEFSGKDMTGRSIREHPDPDYADFARKVYMRACKERAVQVVIEDVFRPDGGGLRLESVVLPLADDTGEVSRLISVFEVQRTT